MEAITTTFRALFMLMILVQLGKSQEELPEICAACLDSCVTDNCVTETGVIKHHKGNTGCQELCFCTDNNSQTPRQTVCKAENRCRRYNQEDGRWRRCSNCSDTTTGNNYNKVDVCRSVNCNAAGFNNCSCSNTLETSICTPIRVCNVTESQVQTCPRSLQDIAEVTIRPTAVGETDEPEAMPITTSAVESSTIIPDDTKQNFTLRYKVNEVFDTDLSNHESPTYQTWSTNVMTSLLEFCDCQPFSVEFYSGSITVVVIVEYSSNYSSQDIIQIINDAEEAGLLLQGHNTSSVVLVLSNGGTRTSDYYAVGNICDSFDDEIHLKPTNSKATVEIPIRVSDLQDSNAQVCSCIFEVANNGIPISRLRANLLVNTTEVVQRDFLQFQACEECEECSTYFPTTSSLWLQDDVSYFSIKMDRTDFDVNSTLFINVLFEETTLWMSCGSTDLTGYARVSEDCQKREKEEDSKTNLALMIIPVTIVVVVGILVVIVVVILVRRKRSDQTSNTESDGAATEAYIKESKGEIKHNMAPEEQEDVYEYITDKDLRSHSSPNNSNLKKKKVPTATLR